MVLGDPLHLVLLEFQGFLGCRGFHHFLGHPAPRCFPALPRVLGRQQLPVVLQVLKPLLDQALLVVLVVLELLKSLVDLEVLVVLLLPMALVVLEDPAVLAALLVLVHRCYPEDQKVLAALPPPGYRQSLVVLGDLADQETLVVRRVLLVLYRQEFRVALLVLGCPRLQEFRQDP